MFFFIPLLPLPSPIAKNRDSSSWILAVFIREQHAYYLQSITNSTNKSLLLLRKIVHLRGKRIDGDLTIMEDPGGDAASLWRLLLNIYCCKFLAEIWDNSQKFLILENRRKSSFFFKLDTNFNSSDWLRFCWEDSVDGVSGKERARRRVIFVLVHRSRS